MALGAVSYASAAALGALLALVVYLCMLLSGNLEPAPSDGMTYHYETVPPPTAVPTQSFDGKGFEAPSKTNLIIQQNPDCWLGVPGATCGPERTFLGE